MSDTELRVTPASLRLISVVVVAVAGISTGLVIGLGVALLGDQPRVAILTLVLGIIEIGALFLVATLLRVVADVLERGHPTYSQVLSRMEERLSRLEAPARARQASAAPLVEEPDRIATPSP